MRDRFIDIYVLNGEMASSKLKFRATSCCHRVTVMNRYFPRGERQMLREIAINL